VARKADFPGPGAFRKAILGLPLKFDGTTLEYTGLSGDRFLFDAGQSRPPQINGQPVNYAPARVYDSPFVQSDWNSGRVRLRKGTRTLALDFNATEPARDHAAGRPFTPPGAAAR
jgi:hypothetical protein